jgi:hypothetical protein
MYVYMSMDGVYTSLVLCATLFTEGINSNILDISARKIKNRREKEKCNLVKNY